MNKENVMREFLNPNDKLNFILECLQENDKEIEKIVWCSENDPGFICIVGLSNVYIKIPSITANTVEVVTPRENFELWFNGGMNEYSGVRSLIYLLEKGNNRRPKKERILTKRGTRKAEKSW